MKSGDINKAKWHTMIGEIMELIELPIQYPTPVEQATHGSILVTNGELSEDVRLSIQSLNQANSRRGFAPLRVIERHELQRMFVEAHGRFLPLELTDLKSFLDLFNSNGRQNIDRSKFSAYLSTILTTTPTGTSSDALRRITSATLLASYLLLPFNSVGNHLAICEAWTVAAAHIYRFAHSQGIDMGSVEPTLLLLVQAIEEELETLKNEVERRGGNFIEGDPSGDGGVMYSIRLCIVLGWLAAYECVQSWRSGSYKISPFLPAMIETESKHLGVWAEYAVPFLATICLLKRRFGDTKGAESLLAGVLNAVATINSGRSNVGFPDPYHTPDQLLSSLYSLPGASIDLGHFAGSSYTARALVDALTQLDRRDLLAPLWEHVSDTRTIEYYPDDPWDMLLWRSDKGRERDIGYDAPTSWSALQASLPDDTELAQPLRDRPDFAVYFMLTYPHRFRRDLFCELLRKFAL